MPKVDPGYLNKNGKALVVLESIIVMVSMVIMLLLGTYYSGNMSVLPLMFDVIHLAVFFTLASQFFSLSLGLYSRELREEFSGIYKRLFLSFILALMIIAVVIKLSGGSNNNLYLLLLAASVSFSLICFLRYQLLSLVSSHSSKRRILVLGAGERASIIEKRMRRAVDRRQIEIVAFVRFGGDLPSAISSQKVIEIQHSLAHFILKNDIEQVVIACDDRRNNLPFNELSKCKIRGVDVIDILSFIENETNQIAIDLVYPEWVIYAKEFKGVTGVSNLTHRVFNSLLSLLIALLTWPLIILAIIAIKFEDGLSAPVFYRQNRVGLSGKCFNIIKLRSMAINAEKGGGGLGTKE